MGGVARRGWARNPHAVETLQQFNQEQRGRAFVTLPHLAADSLVNSLVADD